MGRCGPPGSTKKCREVQPASIYILLVPPQKIQKKMVKGKITPHQKKRKKMARSKSKPTKKVPGVRPCRGAASFQNQRRSVGGIDLSIDRKCFKAIVGSINVRYGTPPKKWSGAAMLALQHGTELYVVHLFSSALLCARHDNRAVVDSKDFHLVRHIEGSS